MAQLIKNTKVSLPLTLSTAVTSSLPQRATPAVIFSNVKVFPRMCYSAFYLKRTVLL